MNPPEVIFPSFIVMVSFPSSCSSLLKSSSGTSALVIVIVWLSSVLESGVYEDRSATFVGVITISPSVVGSPV